MNDLDAEWRETTIGETSQFLTGFAFPSAGFSAAGVRLVRGSNVKRAAIDWSPDIAQYWPMRDSSLRAFELKDDDIVVAMDGALVGRSYGRISKADLPAYLVQRVARLRGTSIDQGLLYAWVGSDHFVQYVDSVKTHTAIPHISPRDIRAFPITVPRDLGEQGRIAKTLAAGDKLVAVLERLITKKQAIKQGMMQRLLTGKTRLPGFTADWTVKGLAELATVDPEALTSRTSPTAIIDYISLEDVSRGTLQSSSRLAFKNAPSRARRVVREMDVLFGTVRPNLQSHMIYVGGLTRPIASTGFSVVRATSGRADPRFLFYLLMSNVAAVQIDRIIAGSNYPAVTSGDVRRLWFEVPDVREQVAIGATLADCDAELELLQLRLSKARAIKQGMMQQLLTGRTRLPVMEPAV